MKTEHEILMQDPEFRRLLSIEALVAQAAELIARAMIEQHLSKAELARRLKKSRPWITQLLSGKANMTVRTLAEVGHTLGIEVKLRAQLSDSRVDANPVRSGGSPMTFKRDGYTVEPPVTGKLFRFQTDQTKSIEDDGPTSPAAQPTPPAYAA